MPISDLGGQERTQTRSPGRSTSGVPVNPDSSHLGELGVLPADVRTADRPGLRGQTVTIGSCVSDTREIAIGYVLLLDFPGGSEDVDS